MAHHLLAYIVLQCVTLCYIVLHCQSTRYGRDFEVGASKEVVVACGTVASPKLLLLSGIGPATHLNQVLVFISVLVLVACVSSW